jgi:hypothetical protein
MKIVRFVLLLSLYVGLLLGISTVGPAAIAAEQTVPGAGNQISAAIAQKSPLVQSAYRFLNQEAEQIQDSQLKAATLDGVGNLTTYVRHRANLTVAQKQAIRKLSVTCCPQLG